MVDVKVNWRCNVTHTWAAEVPASEAYPTLSTPSCTTPTRPSWRLGAPHAQVPLALRGALHPSGRQPRERAGPWQRGPAPSGGLGTGGSSLPTPHGQQRDIHRGQGLEEDTQSEADAVPLVKVCSFLRPQDLFDFWVHIHTCT